MAIRRPLKLDSGNLKDFTVAEMDSVVDEIVRQYGQSPSIALTINQGNGNLTQLGDTRAIAGALATGSSPWPSSDPASTTSVTYNNTVQTITSQTFPYRTGTNWANFSYPVYRTATGHIQAMDPTDIFDTFMTPTLAKLSLGTTTAEGQAGTYFISTNQTESGATQIGSAPVAVDTNADITAFASGSLPETQDQPTTANQFWLHRIDPVSDVDFIAPVSLKIDTSDLQTMPKVTFGQMAQALINHYASTTLRYNYYVSTDTSFGNARGTGITDTYTTGSTERYEQPNSSTYYSQTVPSGTPTVQSTHFLRVGLI